MQQFTQSIKLSLHSAIVSCCHPEIDRLCCVDLNSETESIILSSREEGRIMQPAETLADPAWLLCSCHSR